MIAVRWEAGRLRLHFDKLSDEQAGALDTDREIAVSAGAGAGKTSTLAARFVTLLQRLLDQQREARPDVRAALVLTFTEKAAQEMRERCYAYTAGVARALRTSGDALRAEGMPDAELGRLRAGWDWLRDHFSGAAISTFHAFCARVLREFPAETHTPPGFEVLEESEAEALVEEAAAAEVDARVAAEGPAVALLLETFGGRRALVERVAQLVRARGEVAPTLRAHAEGRVGEADLLALAPLSPGEARAFLEDAWIPFADRLLALCVDVSTPCLEAVAEARLGLDPFPDDALAIYERYGAALAALQKSDGDLRDLSHHTSTGSKAQWGPRHKPSRDPLAALQAEIDPWADRLAHLGRLPNRHDRTLIAVLRALGDVALAAIARHGALLRDARALDFAELQDRVRVAFSEPDGAIARALRERHRWVMVDEFQDTDGLQWSIVQALTRPGGDRLFLVGDVKQAIYGFRGGDVTVFNGALATVPRPVTLSTNYRSRPELIDWFNGVFLDVLGPPRPGRPAWEAPFAPLSAGRTDTGASVRVATHGQRDGAGVEAAFIGELLANEVLPERGAYAGLGLSDVAKHPTPPVAVLLRRRTHLQVYEAALRERGIAYVVVGGVGFWNRPEVVDVANALHALARRDAISMLGVLRSPLLGLTDQQVVDLGRAGLLADFGARPLPDALPDAPRLREAHAVWSRLRELRDHRSLTELVHALLLETRQAWVQARLAPGGRGAANLARLLEMADAHEAAGGTLDAFAARLLRRVEDDARDAEAALPVTDARVAILTVHASKGLEYPVVIVPDLGAPLARGAGPGLLRARLGDGWALACDVPDRFADVATTATPGFARALRAHAREREAAEGRRLFYVACTRARDHLVLVGRKGAADNAATWSDLLAAHLATRAGTPAYEALDDLDAWTPTVTPPAPPPPTPPPPPDAARRLAPIVAEARLDLAPSSLALFARDREAWALRHVFGMPALAARPARAEADLARRAAGVRGDVLHGLLEDDAVEDEAHAHARWRAAAAEAGLSASLADAGWAELRAHLDALRESEDAAAVLAARGYAELPVRLRHGPVTLHGRIDRLCRDPRDGAWMVVDYKSVRAEHDATLDEYRPQLLAYAIAASRVLRARGLPEVARGALLFTRTGRLARLPDWTEADVTGFHATLDEVAATLRGALGGA
ncbi:MAG: UvrD-helicase domain-containing protein [Myxococcota bacterium]